MIENVYIVWSNVMFNDGPLWSIMLCDARLRMITLYGSMLCLMMVLFVSKHFILKKYNTVEMAMYSSHFAFSRYNYRLGYQIHH